MKRLWVDFFLTQAGALLSALRSHHRHVRAAAPPFLQVRVRKLIVTCAHHSPKLVTCARPLPHAYSHSAATLTSHSATVLLAARPFLTGALAHQFS